MTKREACIKAGLARKAQLGPGGYSKLGGGRPKRKLKAQAVQVEVRIEVPKSIPDKLAQIRRMYPELF